MRLRSLLFVPGDSERKFAKGRGVGDVLILDLVGAVAPSMKDAAHGHGLGHDQARERRGSGRATRPLWILSVHAAPT